MHSFFSADLLCLLQNCSHVLVSHARYGILEISAWIENRFGEKALTEKGFLLTCVVQTPIKSTYFSKRMKSKLDVLDNAVKYMLQKVSV